ncbi:aspartate aminotransferase family protein [Candidatus Poribacteria bacterium]|nr:aspartate aminotransferase family protein [Candidatus Poribacteria bacterium]
MDIEEVKKLYNKYVMNTYTRNELSLTHGEGVYVWDNAGKKYLDFLSGIAVSNIGYKHPKWIKSVNEQINNIIHSSNLFYIEPQAKLAQKIIQNSLLGGKCFFCNSGAEANEAAIKLARKYAHNSDSKKRFEIITMEQSFHGRTMATITATGQKKYQEGFDPLLPGFIYSPFNDFDALKSKITDNICAIMIELLQAEGGLRVADKNFIKKTSELCKEKNILFIIDEVQTGIGRCGDLFAYKLYDIEPDIFTLAKALGNGVPIGAMIAKKEIADTFKPGMHASTFGGNHLACSSALAVINTILDENLLSNCKEMEKYLFLCLTKLKNKHSIVKDVRGLGLLIGMELTCPAGDIVAKCMQNGVILNCVQGNVLRFAPPLIIKKEHIDSMIEILDEALLLMYQQK